MIGITRFIESSHHGDIRMNIVSGLFEHMVLQRNRNNASEACITGTSASAGPVQITVRKKGKVLTGFRNAEIGYAERGHFHGCLKGLPTGGSYDIELTIGTESRLVKDVLVGDVWIMGGQSNMQGCGHFPSKDKLPDNTLVRSFYMDDTWRMAKDPLHNMWECVDLVHIDLSYGKRPEKPPPYAGVCPGPAFGQEMRRLTKNVPQGLIACAHGGTSMAQWDPGLKKLDSKSLYGAMLRRIQKNGGKVAGLIWYQGCSDVNQQDAPLYTQRMKKFISALRRDCKNPVLPVAMVQLSRWIGATVEMGSIWNSIQEQQRLLPKHISNLTCVPAIDLTLEDGIHISGRGQNILGRRLAQAMMALTGGRHSGVPPISIGKISTDRVRGMIAVFVEFDNLVGELKSNGRPNGFQVILPNGTEHVFDITLKGKRAILRTNITDDIVMGDSVLHYGNGTNSYCNITDTAGRSLPAFGPIRLGAPRAISPFVRKLRVSKFLPSAGKLENLSCPKLLASHEMRTRTFNGDFCDIRNEERGNVESLVFFAFRFQCREKMNLSAILGYDGPIKVWLDGKQIHYDPNGTNPALSSKAQLKFTAPVGQHEIIIAMGFNHRAAWGICLRLERLDISRDLLVKGAGAYGMPEFLG